MMRQVSYYPEEEMSRKYVLLKDLAPSVSFYWG